MITCQWCGKEMPDDPGSYYHRKDCEAKAIRSQLDDSSLPSEVKKYLERRLELAEYVGD